MGSSMPGPKLYQVEFGAKTGAHASHLEDIMFCPAPTSAAEPMLEVMTHSNGSRRDCEKSAPRPKSEPDERKFVQSRALGAPFLRPKPGGSVFGLATDDSDNRCPVEIHVSNPRMSAKEKLRVRTSTYWHRDDHARTRVFTFPELLAA